MSLTAFHIVFICISFAMAAVVGTWSIQRQGGVGWLSMGIAFYVLGALLAVYGVWYLRKQRRGNLP